MLTEPKYGRFRNGSVTPSEDPAMSSKVAAATPAPSPPASLAHPCPALGEARLPEEQEAVTTFCMLIPKIPQWKFSSPSGFLSRSPSSASKDLSSPAKPGGPGEAGGSSSGLAAVLSACEPVCHSPCSLQVMNRFRGVGGRKAARVEGVKLAGEEWNRKGSFINKPAQGWLHPDERVLGPGVSYIVRYMGCIEVLRSMRSLDFNTRTQVTREAINRLYEAVPGVKGAWKKKAPNKALFSILGKNNLHFAGMSITVNISIDGLNLMIPTTRQIIANHHMQSISFASGGDTDMTDYVAYVAKDPINQRGDPCWPKVWRRAPRTTSCAFIVRSVTGELTTGAPLLPARGLAGILPLWRLLSPGSATASLRDIPASNSSLVYSFLPHPFSLKPFGEAQVFAMQTPDPISPTSSGQSCDGYLQADSQPLGCRDYEEHMYVNTQCLDGWEHEESPPKDLFDMRPFEDALKLHESTVVGGASPPLEDQWPSPPTRKAPIAPTEEQLKREPWYHGKMSRREAEKLLQMDGDFLVRDSITNPGQYVLTGMNGGQPKHLLLVDPEGVVRTKDIRFESISHLINYHLQNEQPIVAAESELHLRQVVKRKQ
ncbi:SHC-transforming protein 2 [Chelonia mydas]|uniref:SHC-transforming protein 2 n=1 Tax=Chelonia mydas TaxID=8469 RepID=M7AIK4_CHEMY|nr:SHC-transforming protein 2 [Chelonia mydas]